MADWVRLELDLIIWLFLLFYDIIRFIRWIFYGGDRMYVDKIGLMNRRIWRRKKLIDWLDRMADAKVRSGSERDRQLMWSRDIIYKEACFDCEFWPCFLESGEDLALSEDEDWLERWQREFFEEILNNPRKYERLRKHLNNGDVRLGMKAAPCPVLAKNWKMRGSVKGCKFDYWTYL